MRALYLSLIFIFTFSCTSLHSVRVPASLVPSQGCFSQLDTFNTPVMRIHSPEIPFRGGMGLGVYINDVLVTGEGYLYSQEEVFNVLGLDEAKLRKLRAEGAKVLSLGEGFGSLLDRFLRSRVEAKAMDLWYHLDGYPMDNFAGKKMFNFNQKYHEHLIRGSFDAIPYSDRSLDLIVASMLFNNIADKDLFVKGVEEIIRVLKVGGEVRLLGLRPYQVELLEGFYNIAFDVQIDKFAIEKVARDDTVSVTTVYRAILRKI